MTDYVVIRRIDGQEVVRYAATSPREVNGFDLVDYDHVPQVEGEEVAPPVVPKTLSKLEYLRRFTQAERIAIRAAATNSAELTDYLAMLELAEVIYTGDVDTIGAVTMLEQVGLIAAGRAQEILNG